MIFSANCKLNVLFLFLISGMRQKQNTNFQYEMNVKTYQIYILLLLSKKRTISFFPFPHLKQCISEAIEHDNIRMRDLK